MRQQQLKNAKKHAQRTAKKAERSPIRPSRSQKTLKSRTRTTEKIHKKTQKTAELSNGQLRVSKFMARDTPIKDKSFQTGFTDYSVPDEIILPATKNTDSDVNQLFFDLEMTGKSPRQAKFDSFDAENENRRYPKIDQNQTVGNVFRTGEVSFEVPFDNQKLRDSFEAEYPQKSNVTSFADLVDSGPKNRTAHHSFDFMEPKEGNSDPEGEETLELESYFEKLQKLRKKAEIAYKRSRSSSLLKNAKRNGSQLPGNQRNRPGKSKTPKKGYPGLSPNSRQIGRNQPTNVVSGVSRSPRYRPVKHSPIPSESKTRNSKWHKMKAYDKKRRMKETKRRKEVDEGRPRELSSRGAPRNAQNGQKNDFSDFDLNGATMDAGDVLNTLNGGATHAEISQDRQRGRGLRKSADFGRNHTFTENEKTPKIRSSRSRSRLKNGLVGTERSRVVRGGADSELMTRFFEDSLQGKNTHFDQNQPKLRPYPAPGTAAAAYHGREGPQYRFENSKSAKKSKNVNNFEYKVRGDIEFFRSDEDDSRPHERKRLYPVDREADFYAQNCQNHPKSAQTGSPTKVIFRTQKELIMETAGDILPGPGSGRRNPPSIYKKTEYKGFNDLNHLEFKKKKIDDFRAVAVDKQLYGAHSRTYAAPSGAREARRAEYSPENRENLSGSDLFDFRGMARKMVQEQFQDQMKHKSSRRSPERSINPPQNEHVKISQKQSSSDFQASLRNSSPKRSSRGASRGSSGSPSRRRAPASRSSSPRKKNLCAPQNMEKRVQERGESQTSKHSRHMESLRQSGEGLGTSKLPGTGFEPKLSMLSETSYKAPVYAKKVVSGGGDVDTVEKGAGGAGKRSEKLMGYYQNLLNNKPSKQVQGSLGAVEGGSVAAGGSPRVQNSLPGSVQVEM